MKTLLMSAMIAVCFQASAAKKTISYQPEIKLSAEEILSMPAQNRLAIAKGQGQGLVPSLEKIAFAKTHDYSMRWKALTLSAQIQGEKSAPLLQKALKAPEWYMRNAALVAYQEVLPQKSKAVAEGLLKDKALVVRSAAVQVLSTKLDNATRETLWAQLGNSQNFRKKQSLFIRGQILAALAKDPQEKEMPLFMKHLKEEDARMHAPAITALEKVTSRNIGKKTDPVTRKRELWMKWAKTQGPELSL